MHAAMYPLYRVSAGLPRRRVRQEQIGETGHRDLVGLGQRLAAVAGHRNLRRTRVIGRRHEKDDIAVVFDTLGTADAAGAAPRDGPGDELAVGCL
ncbi:Uncharacterised protein [Mycobacteroides abscessus subsp. massiliense]|nr:Uncharacterised protein [Mycobacteroides abscessus subsp. massiliense]